MLYKFTKTSKRAKKKNIFATWHFIRTNNRKKIIINKHASQRSKTVDICKLALVLRPTTKILRNLTC